MASRTEQSGTPSQTGLQTLMKEVQGLREKLKGDEDEQYSPFQGLDKSVVMQNTSIFSDAEIVMRQPRKCCQLITKLLHLLTTGEEFTDTEATDVFFGVSKLFQSKDANLRRMMYLFIKAFAECTNPEYVIIVTSSLTKDMNSDVDLYKANSLRVLCKIIDAQMLNAIERYIKQAIVSTNAFVSASALVSGIHLMKSNPQIVQRWINEVQEAVNSPDASVQHHAVCLLYMIKKHDRLAVSKLVAQLSKSGNMRSPLAICMLIRYTAQILQGELTQQSQRVAYQFLESSLRHKSEAVVYEAAKAMCDLPNLDARDLSPAISVLQLFLSSPKASLRFAAIRTLNKVSVTQPVPVTKCNDEMEELISDSNRSIATLAITTLLRTSGESQIDSLIKQIGAFITEITDEFKVVVVEAIRSLCLKFPTKFRVLMGFLANFLREEGGFEFKKSITDSILHIMQTIPETKETGLFQLCEFIEDCEFAQLSVQILHVLGDVGPETAVPARYIRYIYNRIILENAVIRAAAVSALGKFATKVESLVPSILVLLRRSLSDDDDEVRDRATNLISALEKGTEVAELAVLRPLPMSVNGLMRSLELYQQRPVDGPVTFDVLPIVEDEEIKPVESSGIFGSAPTMPQESETPASSKQEAVSALYSIPEFADLGQIFRSSPLLELCEPESEYVVSCLKHVFKDHLVLQFNCTNTVEGVLLEDAGVALEVDGDGWELESEVRCPEIKYGATGTCYVCLSRAADEDEFATKATVECELKFNLIDVDPATGEHESEGFEEVFPLEPVNVTTADFLAKVAVPDFRVNWENMGEDSQAGESFGLKFKSIGEAVSRCIDFIGMQPCENTAVAQPKSKTHMILLSGVFVGGVKVLARCHLKLDPNATAGGTILKIIVRSNDAKVSQLVADGFDDPNV